MVRIQVPQPKNRIAVFAKIRSYASRRDGGFRENQPRVFEIKKKLDVEYNKYVILNLITATKYIEEQIGGKGRILLVEKFYSHLYMHPLLKSR